jgi:hypothetical protein
VICSEYTPDSPARAPNAPNATEKSSAKAALYLFLAGAALLLGAGAVWGVLTLRRVLFTENPVYRLAARPEIRNRSGQLTDEEILRGLGLSDHDREKGVNLYALDLAALRKGFLAAHPGVSDLTLERFPPDRLVVSLGERSAYARIGSSKFAVDDAGQIFVMPRPMEATADTLPVIRSERLADLRDGGVLPSQDRVALDVLRVARHFTPPLCFRIVAIDLTDELYLDLTTEQNVYLRLPLDFLQKGEKAIHRALQYSHYAIEAGNNAPGGTLLFVEAKNNLPDRVITQ